jgi:DNA polymerase IV
VGLLDLDAFFASVEQMDHPEWRGLPLIVGGDAERRGVVSTCSYEARRFGVHSAMPSAQAKRLCPQAIWVHGRHERYREVSAQVMAIILDETPYMEQMSIDEAYFDVTPGRFSCADPVEVCARISHRVEELGVTCSIGLSCCKTVSKIASERNKPNGTTVVYPGCEEGFLAPMSVRALPGVGPQTAAALERVGIRTLGELAHADRTLLSGLGSAGPELSARARGVDPSPVADHSRREGVKSVSCERTFAHDLTGTDEVHDALASVCAETARRLRAKGLRGRCVCVKCCQEFGRTRSAQTTLERRVDDEHDILPVAKELLGQLWRPGEHVRLLGVGVSHWEEGAWHASLFDDVDELDREQERRSNLASAKDALRGRFGSDVLMSGAELRLQQRLGEQGKE